MLKIISTGFEGGECAALDAAIDKLHPWGGTCPKGRSGQFSQIPDHYFTGNGKGALVEGSSSRPTPARFANARDAEATLVLSMTSAKIPMVCKDIIIMLRQDKGRYLIADPRKTYEVKRVVRWIAESNLRILNISSSPKKNDDPFTTRTFVFIKDVLTYTTLYSTTGVKIWT